MQRCFEYLAVAGPGTPLWVRSSSGADHCGFDHYRGSGPEGWPWSRSSQGGNPPPRPVRTAPGGIGLQQQQQEQQQQQQQGMPSIEELALEPDLGTLVVWRRHVRWLGKWGSWPLLLLWFEWKCSRVWKHLAVRCEDELRADAFTHTQAARRGLAQYCEQQYSEWSELPDSEQHYRLEQ
jgi:hypothetical protein